MKTENIAALAGLLNIEDKDALKHESTVPRPPSTTGHGLVVQTHEKIEDIAQYLLGHDDLLERWTELEDAAPGLRGYSCSVKNVYAFDEPEKLTPLGGDWLIQDDVLFFRVTQESRTPSALSFTLPDGERILGLDERGAEIFRISPPASERMRKLADTAATSLPTVPAPNIEDILQGSSREPWLEHEAREKAASENTMDRLCAVGMIARLWIPTDRDEKRALERTLITGGQSPVVQKSESYIRSISPETLEQLDSLAASSVGNLHTSLEMLESAVVEREPDTDALAQSFLLDRDDAACIACLLELGGSGEKTATVLEALDARAKIMAGIIDDAKAPSHPRLEAVGWQEPTAWWGLS